MSIIASDKELYDIVPKCLNTKQPMFAVTKFGELIPCCWLDTSTNREDPSYKKLLAVSKLSDYESIDELILTEEWLEFNDYIRDGKSPFYGCLRNCKKGVQIKKEIYLASAGSVTAKKEY